MTSLKGAFQGGRRCAKSPSSGGFVCQYFSDEMLMEVLFRHRLKLSRSMWRNGMQASISPMPSFVVEPLLIQLFRLQARLVLAFIALMAISVINRDQSPCDGVNAIRTSRASLSTGWFQILDWLEYRGLGALMHPSPSRNPAIYAFCSFFKCVICVFFVYMSSLGIALKLCSLCVVFFVSRFHRYKPILINLLLDCNAMLSTF